MRIHQKKKKKEIAMSHDKQRNMCIFNAKGLFGYRLLIKTENTVVK